MLSLYHAADLETLGQLATRLLAQPPRDPLAPTRVVVPSQGIGRWLTLQLAQVQGIAMHLDLQLPARFVWDLARQVLGALPEQSAFSPQTLTWRLYDWLCEPANLQRTERLQHYMQGGDERRRLALAARIADVFDQYLLYRDDWLAVWERGERCDLGHDEAWQALLWRELTAAGHPHRARLLEDLLRRLHDPTPLRGLPECLLVFGISSLPLQHLRVLEGLARHTEVVIFALNPCREAWGEIRDIRELARADLSAPAPPMGSDTWYLDIGHPLLASLGKQGRDFFDHLLALASGEGSSEQGIYPEDTELQDDSLLHALQNDILRLRRRQPEERLSLREDDRSLELHIAHSPLREVEILHDQLLARFAGDPTLTPDQVVVLTPDIERYAPFVEAVFAAREGVPRIPYSLADRSLRVEIPLIDTFLSLLALPDSRFGSEEILALLEQPALAVRAGIETEELPLLRDWLREAGVRWGRDAAHRTSLGLPADASFTWQQGLDRLLLGFATPPQLAAERPPLLGDSWPLDVVEGARAQLLGRLASFVERLAAVALTLQRPRRLDDWATCLQGLLDELFDERETGDTLLLLSQACATLAQQASAAEFTRPLELALVRQQLSTALQQDSHTAGFLSGAVTFCSMVPMRSLPFALVCLLGLDDGALPRQTPAAGFDLISRHPRQGDRARRLDDRYLLLETLLSARQAIYLSYVGRDLRSNAELPPSVLLSELLEVVDQTAFCSSKADQDQDNPPPQTPQASARLTISHPLQPFAPENFTHESRRTSYANHWFSAARQLAEVPQEPQPFIHSLPAPDPAWLTLEPAQLLKCFRNPARYLLEQRLGLRLPGSDDAIAAEEPFALERPAYALRKLALQAVEYDWSEAEERRVASASGLLPSGALGQALLGTLRAPIRAFAPRLFEARPKQPPQPLLVNLHLGGVQLHGWLDGVTLHGLFDWTLNALGGKDLIRFWLRHLLLNLCAPAAVHRHSLLISPKGDWQLEPLDNPAALLEPWLIAYREALCEPLPFMPTSSYDFAKALCMPSLRSKKDPLDAARSAWFGSEYSPIAGEAQDPWYALAFRDRDPLGKRFEQLAEQLLGPALLALHAVDED